MPMNELVQQEEKIIKRIFELKQRLISSEFREHDREYDIWINTDFPKLGLKNADQRKAYVKKQQAKYIKTSSLVKSQLYLCEELLKLVRMKERAFLELKYKDKYNFYDEMIAAAFKEVGIDDSDNSGSGESDN